MQPDTNGYPDSSPEESLRNAMHTNRIARFVERNGLDALPEGALQRRLDENASEDIQLQQLTTMLQAQRVLHGFTRDGRDPNAQPKPRPAQTMPTRGIDD